MIRWTFVFNEGNVQSDVTREEEDNRIGEYISSLGFLHLPGTDADLYINPSMAKCIVRQILEAQELPKEIPAT